MLRTMSSLGVPNFYSAQPSMPKLWPIIHFPQVNVLVPSGLKLLTFTRKVTFVVELIHSEKSKKGQNLDQNRNERSIV